MIKPVFGSTAIMPPSIGGTPGPMPQAGARLGRPPTPGLFYASRPPSRAQRIGTPMAYGHPLTRTTAAGSRHLSGDGAEWPGHQTAAEDDQ
jgi:hypothetical protein